MLPRCLSGITRRLGGWITGGRPPAAPSRPAFDPNVTTLRDPYRPPSLLELPGQEATNAEPASACSPDGTAEARRPVGENRTPTVAESLLLSVAVPLREESPDVFLVGESRVPLESVIREFQAGGTPEAIVQSLDTLSLADVYAVLAYYLADPRPVEEYQRRREGDTSPTAPTIRRSLPPRQNFRDLVLARARARDASRARTRPDAGGVHGWAGRTAGFRQLHDLLDGPGGLAAPVSFAGG